MDEHVDAVDLERATDQLVDEICQRLNALHTLVPTTTLDIGPTVQEIRRHAPAVVDRLAGDHGRGTAIAVARTLWPPHPGAHVPSAWWTTPLGRLVACAVDARPPLARRR